MVARSNITRLLSKTGVFLHIPAIMWAFRLTLLAGVLTRLIVLGRTTPINDVYSYITSRSQFCANAPLTVAGT